MVFAGDAHATHLKNVNSGKCLNSDAVQANCSPVGGQDVAFDSLGNGKYHLRISTQCIKAMSSSPNTTVTFASCSSDSSMSWKLYRATSGSVTRQYQNDLGNCLGVFGDSTSNGDAIQTVDCGTAASIEWSTDLEFVFSQNPSSSTVPVFNISGSNLGTVIEGQTAAVDAQCSCDTFSLGPYCALAANHSRAATCRSYSSRTLASNKPLTVTTRGVTDTIPTYESVTARTDMGTSGRIDAVSGQTIENLRISTTVGPCIYIADGVHDVTIRNNQIGPCTQASPPAEDGGIFDFGIFIVNSGVHIDINQNVFVNASTMIFMTAGQDITVYRNWFGNPLGPRWAGATVQLADVVGSNPSKVSCNIFDGRYAVPQLRPTISEDKINLGGATHGSSGTPFEIAHNRILGPTIGGGDSGSGLQIGDLLTTDFGWINIHHNTIIYANGGGITISGGHDIVIDNNRVDSRGEDTDTNTGVSFNWSTFYPERAACTNLTVTNNRGISRIWYYGGTGDEYDLANDGNCTNETKSNNNFGDTTLTGIDMFNEPYAECEE